MKEKNLTQNKFEEKFNVSDSVMDCLRNNKPMTLESLIEPMRMLEVKQLSKVLKTEVVEENENAD